MRSELETIRELLSSFRINENTWTMICEQLHDVEKRDGKKASLILRDLLEKIPSHYDAPGKLKCLKEELQQSRYPRYSQKKKEFEKKLTLLKTPVFVQVTHAPFFEDSSLEIKAKLGSDDDRKELVSFLERMENFQK